MPLQAPANTAPACIPAAYDRTTAPDQAAAPACCVLVAFRVCFLDGELTIHHLNLGTKQVTRLCGPLLDNCWRYAVSGKPAAPGQLPTIYVSGTRELLQIEPGKKLLQAGPKLGAAPEDASLGATKKWIVYPVLDERIVL
jgi:hypothetical protein